MVRATKRASTRAAKSDSPVRTGAGAGCSSQDIPLISVIVPVYNTKSTIERCVNSILTQTYPNLEIILVDDGSPDGAGELCDQLAQKHKNVRVLHQKNAGLSAARNAALKIAQGELITFVDSDDAIYPNMLDELIGLRNSPVRICSFTEVAPNGQRHAITGAVSWQKGYIMPAEVKRRSFTVENCLRQMLLEQGFTMSACGKLYHRNLFKTVQFPVGKLYEDVGTTYRLIMQCPDDVQFIPLPFYAYYQNADSIIHQNFNFHKLDLIELTDQMCNDIDQKFPSLQSVTNLRRMHARFSILRQMVLAKPSAQDKVKFQQVEQEITQYLLQHKDWVLRCPDASRRDRLAMRSLLLGRPVFKLAWKIYSRLR